MAITENGSHAEGIWRCAGGDSRFLTISFWKEVPGFPTVEVEGFLRIEGKDRFYSQWKQRVKGAWRLLRGKDTGYADVVLDDPVKAREAAAVLLAFADECDRWRSRMSITTSTKETE